MTFTIFLKATHNYCIIFLKRGIEAGGIPNEIKFICTLQPLGGDGRLSGSALSRLPSQAGLCCRAS
jgi:hypothetical protein